MSSVEEKLKINEISAVGINNNKINEINVTQTKEYSERSKEIKKTAYIWRH